MKNSIITICLFMTAFGYGQKETIKDSISTKLNEVIVSSQNKLFTNKNGNIKVDVANSIYNSTPNTIDLLAKLPNIQVSTDKESITVIGKGNPLIYIDNQKVGINDLNSLAVDAIKSIEIINNPSSKYDAEGKAVINIITVTNFGEGYSGTVNQYFSVSDFSAPNSTANVNVNYKKRKISLIGGYGLLLGETREILNTTRKRPQEIDNFKSKLRTDWEREYKNFSNYTVGGQYDFNEKKYISVEYSGYSNSLGGTTKSENSITSYSTNGLFESKIDNDVITYNNSISANYNTKIDTLGTSLFIGTQYSVFDSETNDYIDENNSVNGEQSFRNLNNKINHKIKVFSSQIDYSKVFSSKSKFDFGAKYSNVGNKSNSDFYAAEIGNLFILDEQLSNYFEYQEMISAVYMNYGGEINKKTNYGIGIRSEFTKYGLNTIIQKKEDYIDFFPSAYLNVKLSGKTQIRISYASRITRPRYQALNPSIIYQDAFTTIEGNPDLKPERTHSFEMSTSFSKYNFKVGYNYTTDPISGAALEGDNQNSYVLKILNLSKLHSYFASLSIPYSNNWWISMNTVNMSYDELISNHIIFSLKESKPLYYFYSSNQFDFKKIVKVQLLGWYLGEKYDGLFYRKSRSLITLGVEKDFYNQSLKVKFMANDIFHRDKPVGNYEVGQTFVEYGRTLNTNYYRLILTYNFGKLKKINYGNTSSGASESGRAQ